MEIGHIVVLKVEGQCFNSICQKMARKLLVITYDVTGSHIHGFCRANPLQVLLAEDKERQCGCEQLTCRFQEHLHFLMWAIEMGHWEQCKAECIRACTVL